MFRSVPFHDPINILTFTASSDHLLPDGENIHALMSTKSILLLVVDNIIAHGAGAEHV